MRRLVVVLALCLATPRSFAQKPATPKTPSQTLLAAADEIARQVSALRNLPLKAPLVRGVLSRGDIMVKLKARMAKEYTPEEVRAESRVLVRLGLLPAGTDYERLLLDVLAEQVAGFYDPFAARLYIADWLPIEMQRPAMAHEIEHALQDQHFKLKRFAEPIKDNGDRQLARAALVEGDGTLLMLEFQAQSMHIPVDQLPELVASMGKQMLSAGLGDTPLLAKAPTFVKETLLFPYLGGLGFVAHLKRDGWARVDAAWKSPPESTEQVLHPEKYLARELPIVVKAPALALPGRNELRRDVVGELEWRVLLAQAMTEAEAERAAAGWGGDQLVAWVDAAQPTQLPAVALFSVWDTVTDAREAEAALRKLMATLCPGADGADGGARACAGESFVVERREERVLAFFGVPEAQTAAALERAWASSWAAPPRQPAR